MLTPQIQLDSSTTLVTSSAVVVRVGSSLSLAGMASISATSSGASWTFGQVSNTANNVADAQDEIVMQVQARVNLAAASETRLVPIVTVVHRGTPTLTAANASIVAEVVVPVLLRTSLALPSGGGAYGDTTQFTFTLAHSAALSSNCSQDVRVCESPPIDMDFVVGSVIVSGVTPAPTVSQTSPFCFSLSTLTAPTALSVTYSAMFRDLPAGIDRCSNGNVSFTTAVGASAGTRNSSSSVCVRQQVLETVGDFVWLDGDGDGQQDANETPIVGASVRLRLSSSNALVATTSTSTNGTYQFDRRQHGLQPNVGYSIELDARVGLHASLANQVADDSDSDGVASGAAIVVVRNVSVTARTQNFTIDFGFAPPIVLGDFVWRDLNGDGVQNDGSGSALANVLVQLRLSSNNSVVATTNTTSTGFYSFSSLNVSALVPGVSFLIVIPLDSQTVLKTRVGGRNTFLVPTLLGASSSALDNNAVLDAAKTSGIVSYTVPNRWNVSDSSLDFGLVPPPPLGVRVGDRVFLDVNSNGLQDAADLSVAGLTLQLINANSSVIATTVTNATGYYQFVWSITQEPVEIYTIVVPNGQTQLVGRGPTARDVGSNDTLDSDATRDVDSGRIFVTLVAPIDGQNDFSIDIGLRSPSTNATVTQLLDASLPMCLGTQIPCESATLFDGSECAFNAVCAQQYLLTTIDQLKTEAPISIVQVNNNKRERFSHSF